MSGIRCKTGLDTGGNLSAKEKYSSRHGIFSHKG